MDDDDPTLFPQKNPPLMPAEYTSLILGTFPSKSHTHTIYLQRCLHIHITYNIIPCHSFRFSQNYRTSGLPGARRSHWNLFNKAFLSLPLSSSLLVTRIDYFKTRIAATSIYMLPEYHLYSEQSRYFLFFPFQNSHLLCDSSIFTSPSLPCFTPRISWMELANICFYLRY